KKNNIQILSAGEANSNAVGEHAIGMLLNLMNNIGISNEEIKTNVWEREKNRGIELDKKVVGIIGFGKTGQSFAKKLSGFDCKVIFYDIKKIPSNEYANSVSLNEIKLKSDIISIHTDLNQGSLNLVNMDFIKSCKKKFILINTSRGKCVNTKDVVSGLIENKIIGACLDVLDLEEISFEKIQSNQDLDYLKESDKVILTPHIAGWTHESKLKLSKVIIEKIKKI
ncbi:MAG: NAD(P)-dependent oxidoreductase, partial [Bacteroidota bacterium]|nr:NAD(P)-dependent oxidoreductase [Bacteroidota bacterium]